MKRTMPQSQDCMLIVRSILVGLMVAGGASPALSASDAHPTTPSSERNWDKKLPSSSRFTVLSAFGDAAVRDDETGLVWEKTVDTTEMSWTDARALCRQGRRRTERLEIALDLRIGEFGGSFHPIGTHPPSRSSLRQRVDGRVLVSDLRHGQSKTRLARVLRHRKGHLRL